MSILHQQQSEPVGPRCWGADVKDRPTSWSFQIDRTLQDLIESKVFSPQNNGVPPTKLALSDEERALGRQALSTVVAALDDGPGFALIDRIPMDRYTPEQATSAYWLIGQMVGRPVVQNVKGALLYDVRDMGGDYTKGARFSVTRAETSFHTDGAFFASPPDYVGLLCLRTAHTGGQSQLVSGHTVCKLLLSERSDSIESLSGLFYFDRRGEHTLDEAPFASHPVIAWNEGRLTMRYLNYYIETGHEKAGTQLSLPQREALGALEEIFRRPDIMVSLSLERGQMLIVNNHWILHNRTAYEDHRDPSVRRHYVRLWLKSD